MGTSRALQEVYEFLSQWSTLESVDFFCTSNQIKWHHLHAILGKDGLLHVSGRFKNAPINVD